jgi:hypothetical protein
MAGPEQGLHARGRCIVPGYNTLVFMYTEAGHLLQPLAFLSMIHQVSLTELHLPAGGMLTGVGALASELEALSTRRSSLEQDLVAAARALHREALRQAQQVGW